MSDAVTQELLGLNQKLLNAIVAGDWATYATLCDASLTCFEREAHGQLVVGLDFHKYYFPPVGTPLAPCNRQVTMCSPHVRVMGDSAVLSYVRLNQYPDAQGNLSTSAVEETRVWQKLNGAWKHVHFHRSPIA